MQVVFVSSRGTASRNRLLLDTPPRSPLRCESANRCNRLQTLREVLRVTLSELAQLLKVSPSTISRAVHRPEMVAEATRERILAAVAKHGYRTNGIARSLRKGETQTVGLVVADLQNPFYSVMVKAIENTLSAEGYSCVICDADESQHKEQRALRLIKALTYPVEGRLRREGRCLTPTRMIFGEVHQIVKPGCHFDDIAIAPLLFPKHQRDAVHPLEVRDVMAGGGGHGGARMLLRKRSERR